LLIKQIHAAMQYYCYVEINPARAFRRSGNEYEQGKRGVFDSFAPASRLSAPVTFYPVFRQAVSEEDAT